jgi:hypothetical protein
MKRMVLVATVALLPSLAHAQSEDPGECTTTVHCTGAAARYAVPGAVQPAAPPPPMAPPPIPPPAYYPPPAYPNNVVMLDLRKLESDGWKLVQHSDGSLWRERHVSTASPAVWGTGLALFAASWLGSGIGSLVSQNGLGPLGFLPVFGAWGNAIAASGHNNCTYYDSYSYNCSDRKGELAGWAIGGIAQAAGFTMFLVGLASGPKKLERQPVMLAPGAVGSGGGLNAVGQF